MLENNQENIFTKPLSEFSSFEPNEPEKIASREKFRFIQKLPKLSSDQVQKLSDIVADTGIVSLGSVILPVILSQLKPIYLIIGMPLTLLFWTTSIVLLRYKN